MFQSPFYEWGSSYRAGILAFACFLHCHCTQFSSEATASDSSRVIPWLSDGKYTIKDLNRNLDAFGEKYVSEDKGCQTGGSSGSGETGSGSNTCWPLLELPMKPVPLQVLSNAVGEGTTSTGSGSGSMSPQCRSGPCSSASESCGSSSCRCIALQKSVIPSATTAFVALCLDALSHRRRPGGRKRAVGGASDDGFISDEGVVDHPCPCNSTYVSHSCCDSKTGLVWEEPHQRLGELVDWHANSTRTPT